ncbi:MAG: gas vesicle protein [Pseudomonadota bacterium]
MDHLGPGGRDGLADILERVLEKGVVVAGDITVAIAGVELLTIKVRLLVTTVDKALEMGINWWEHDPMLSPAQGGELSALEQRLAALEAQQAVADGAR